MAARKLTIGGLLLFAVGLAVLFSGCHSADDPWNKTPKKRVVTSFPPIYCFTENVAGDHVALRCLCTTRGPHDYEYNPKDTMQLKTADLLLSNGQGMDDHFVDRLQANAGNGKLRVRKLGDTDRIKLLKMGAHNHVEGEPHHHHGEYDPHIWLGIDEAIAMVEGIRDELKSLDPAHAGDFDKNAGDYIVRLKKLHQEGLEKLKDRKLTIVTFHESLTYFARSFGITIAGSIQGAPGSDPQSQRKSDLIELCKKHNARIITTEPQYPDAAAMTLKSSLQKQNIDAVLVPIDPLETATLEDITATWYEDKMRENINNLANAAKPQ